MSTIHAQVLSRSTTRCYQFTDDDRHTFELRQCIKDEELWDETGDCFIFLGQSTPAYRLPLHTLKQHKALYLLKNIQSAVRAQSPKSCISSDSGYESSHLNNLQGPYELHISIPVGLTNRDIPKYNIITRNYFAYLQDKPLIGSSLGTALRDVWQRIQRWHGEEANIGNFLSYCEKQGYTEYTGRPYNATAMLAFAEGARQRDLWINAYAHCVAMHDRIDKDSDFDALTNTTKALVTKGSLELELRIRRVVRAVGNLLEGELSSEKLGLSKPGRDHLDHFRSFLHSFFLEKLGYFPPTENEDNFDKDIWQDIHDDFEALYDYLADGESVSDTLSNRGVIGGVCVHQNVDAFDQRHSFEPLQHPLPLLPDLTPTRRTTESQVTLRNFKLVRVDSDFRPSLKQALTTASNSEDATLLERPIVQDYIRFEGQRLEEKLSVAEARKIRWLLIYCTLQMLKSIVIPPREIENAGSAPYSLCISTSGCPIWSNDNLPRTQSVNSIHTTSLEAPINDDTDRVSIHPDCEADNAQEFFSSTRRGSVAFDKSEDEESSSPARVLPSRSLSIRTSVHSSMNALQKTVIGGLSRRNSSRKSLQLTPKRMSSLQDISVEDAQTAQYDEVMTSTPTVVEEFDFEDAFPRSDRAEVTSIPLLEDHQLDMLTPMQRSTTPQQPILEVEQLSPASDVSRRSSTHSECETPVSEPSSRSSSTRESKLLNKLAPLDEDSILITASGRPRTAFHSSPSMTSLNVGCYRPSGYAQHDVPLSKFATPRHQVYERRQDVASTNHSRNRYSTRQSNATDHYTWGDMP